MTGWRMLIAVAAAGALVSGCNRSPEAAPRTVRVARGPAQVWTAYEGQLESRQVRDIMSSAGGSAVIVELAAEGTVVKPGDLLVRLDASQFERDLLRLERDYTLAVSELHSLTNAKLPLELRELEIRQLEARRLLATEEQLLADDLELAREKLVSELDVGKQRQKVESARLAATNLEQQLELTRQHLHPAAVEAARARVQSAEQERQLARDQVEQCTIRAPASGYVVYKPVHVGGEFRTVRVGDTVFKNQPFMALPDLGDLVVQVDVPEAELGLVRSGMKVVVEPAAYPDLRLDGRVESVGSMAQSRAGRPAWQKFFRVTIGLGGGHPDLRTGMSVTARILSADEPQALLIPRLAVRWEQDQPVCEVLRGGVREVRHLRLGAATEQEFCVLEGLNAGDEVLLP